jgi:hypothetical protein
MAGSSSVRRRLYIHPAHTTVGVSGRGVALGPYYRLGERPIGDSRPGPLRVLLVDREADPNRPTAVALLEQHLRQRCDVQCDRVDFDAFDAKRDHLADADCLIVLGRGLRMAANWRDLDVNVCAQSGTAAAADEQMKIEPAMAAYGHPVLDEVRPFVARGGVVPIGGLPSGATCLLVGTMSGKDHPLAWAWRGRRGSSFFTSLGSANDLRQPDFVRLLFNAMDWIGGQGR